MGFIRVRGVPETVYFGVIVPNDNAAGSRAGNPLLYGYAVPGSKYRNYVPGMSSYAPGETNKLRLPAGTTCFPS